MKIDAGYGVTSQYNNWINLLNLPFLVTLKVQHKLHFLPAAHASIVLNLDLERWLDKFKEKPRNVLANVKTALGMWFSYIGF